MGWNICNKSGWVLIDLYVNGDNETFFDSFGDENILKKIKN